MDWLVDTIKTIDPTATPTKLLLLDFEASNDIAIMACTWTVVECLSFAWARRKQKKVININALISSLTAKATVLRNSCSFKNVSRLVHNLIK